MPPDDIIQIRLKKLKISEVALYRGCKLKQSITLKLIYVTF